MNPRLIRIEYEGAMGNGVGHAVTFEGAIRAATVRLFTEQYHVATIFDLRFNAPLDLAHAITIQRHSNGLAITWRDNQKPRT